ncbi:hypothetical protein C1637_03475 [Chryseobacterium lactis]|uniref:Uncharacterized protein n=1 Tax=Chryseobacterium lactis TaxID=1241981 RepID=A0A3G6RXM2_CHRLC|nr:hypothetical protein [Chryseobacterium lactis]AZA81646.1 hypothetical protein EG342_06870 [Chryseobacterium lactis]AZB06644.1 hypothetical protein EG341_22990 [Chryseobacterium lactis]PNW15495.1 hypothetical protein C1637_03475 [Chryseobacterium lactis]
MKQGKYILSIPFFFLLFVSVLSFSETGTDKDFNTIQKGEQLKRLSQSDIKGDFIHKTVITSYNFKQECTEQACERRDALSVFETKIAFYAGLQESLSINEILKEYN